MVNHELVTNWILDLRKKLQRQRKLSKFCPGQTEGWRCHLLRRENGRCHRLQGKVGDQLRAPEPSWKEFPMQPVSVSASESFMILGVPESGSFMMQRVSPSHPGPLPAPGSSWQPGARLRPWRPATVSPLAASSQRRISIPRCVACRLFFLRKQGSNGHVRRLQEQRATLTKPKSCQSTGKLSLQTEERRESTFVYLPGGLVARIWRFHRCDPGLLPGQGIVLHWPASRGNLPLLHCQSACSKGQMQNSLRSKGHTRAK
uniref:Uncharacterized protein n=1 Tax=Theropithecus gelada TaxID=9565 RepID=A0A8D2F222_THEGE